MNTKAFLQKGYRINLEIETRQQVIDELKSTMDGLKGINYKIEKVQGGTMEAEHLTEKIAKIEELEKKITYLHNLLYQINEKIDSLENPNERLILRMRYILNFKWDSICDKMGYSKRQVQRIHDEAIKKIKMA
ncbi:MULTISPECIES: DUF1492 domain-containing protein [unclassified Fusobacterium]|uniref:DUF1492 domain-containing protein n=1 Tax=unclassified Fusobacterium TaxID=2648384 RepID=UPI001B8CAA39|nr:MULTISPECIES: DUF1492 domain-containing protein [unclassified Fusobacterium]MBR8701654.1 hypothetical protein [Fusobacterium sp. DD45]MBR8711435.1 hypothetical protein [Fusobacterium sp. DD28]MBR8751984.1 hypothetical protein [Fusobacterium sp. DD26]